MQNHVAGKGYLISYNSKFCFIWTLKLNISQFLVEYIRYMLLIKSPRP